MKQLLFATLMLLVSLASFAQETNQAATRCQFSSQYIHEGDKAIGLTYDPAGTVLANETDIKCVLYLFQDRKWQAYDIDILQKEGKWIGTFDVPVDASLLLCKFTSGSVLNGPNSVKTDWGWPATYASFVLDKNNNCKPGSYVAWGLLRQQYGNNSIPGLLEDSTAAPIGNDVVLYWHNQEFRYNPSEQPNHFKTLVATLRAVKPDEKNEQLKENLLHFLNDKDTNLTDQQLADMYDIATRTLNDSALANEIKQKEQKMYKHGIIERDVELMRVMNEIAVKKMDAIGEFEKFMKTYPTEKFRDVHTFMTDIQYKNIFRSGTYTPVMMKDDYSYLVRYIHDFPYMELTTTHWHMCDSPFSNGHTTADHVIEWSRLIIKEMKERPRLEACQLIYSPREWKEQIIAMHTMAWNAHARILTACGQYQEAMEYAQEVYPWYEAGNNEFATMWIKLLKENGRSAEVPAYLEKCVHANITSQEMIDELKTSYLAKDPNGDFDKYLNSLKNQSEADVQRQKILSELVDMPAELLELEKLGGGKVNLADRKGKIMFLDFWATWCAPCKASMPGGQIAVDRYKDDPDVEFYFIDTQEMKADYRQKVADFIKQKGFTFNVLFDKGETGKQSKQYDAIAKPLHNSGIPFKVIIDAKGRLRWSMCGYNGSPTGMADEIQYVIDYLKNEN